MAVSLVRGLLKLACFYLFIRLPFVVIQQLLWLLGGIQSEVKIRYAGRKYESSAHVCDIIGKGGRIGAPTPTNIFAQHVNWEHPEYVLSDKCSLYYVDKQSAYFIEVPPFERVDRVDIYDHNAVGPMDEAQYRHSHRLIPLPLSSLHRLADKLGEPPGTLVFLHHTDSAGATLLTQTLAKTGNVLCMNEPAVLGSLTRLKTCLSQQEYERVLQSTVRLLCKPQKDKTYSAYVIKAPIMSLSVVNDLIKALPTSRHFFMYRNAVDTIQAKIPRRKDQLQSVVAETLFKYRPTVLPFFRSLPAGVLDVIKDRCEVTYLGLEWAAILVIFKQINKNGGNVAGIRLEDILGDNREKALKSVFESANLPTDVGQKALKEFDKAYEEWSKENPSVNNNNKLASDLLIQLDAACDKLGVPRVSQPCYLQGTITSE